MLEGHLYVAPDHIEKCSIRSFSTLGATIRLSTSYPLPERFELEVVRWGQRFKARRLWTDWKDVGVEFHEPLQIFSADVSKVTLLAAMDAHDDSVSLVTSGCIPCVLS